MMKKELIFLPLLLTALITSGSFAADRLSTNGVLLAQAFDEDDLFDEDDDGLEDEDAQKRREQEEAARIAEEKRRAEEARRVAISKQRVKERKIAEQKKKELDALREKSKDTTEYTIDPSSVELVVEMDPNNYGFRVRNHRMTMGVDLDLIFRGRGMFHYDFRFFEYLSMSLMAGADWSPMSLYSEFRKHLSKPSPSRISVLGGASAKWRLTEWYLHSAIFLEPSFLFGHVWQKLATQDTTHWVLRPGIFAGVETVFDSGLTVSTKLGVEFPFYFGQPNAYKEVADPLFAVGLGFSL